MSEKKHTPGSWTFQGGGQDVINIRAGDAQVALVGKFADARLIAAAPEMLDLLERIVRYQLIPDHWTTAETARAVIAKATGTEEEA